MKLGKMGLQSIKLLSVCHLRRGKAWKRFSEARSLLGLGCSHRVALVASRYRKIVPIVQALTDLLSQLRRAR